MKRAAITMRRVTDPAHGEVRDCIARDMSGYFARNFPDLIAIPMPNDPARVETWAQALRIEAAILINGNDWGADAERDAAETALVAWCRARGLPVLGICRGMQALNAMCGGEIQPGAPGERSHAGTAHEVALTAPFAALAGKGTITVNSFHDQYVTQETLAADLAAFATAPAGRVEGLCHPQEPILAVQWHPERDGAPADFDRKLIDTFFTKGAFWRAGASS